MPSLRTLPLLLSALLAGPAVAQVLQIYDPASVATANNTGQIAATAESIRLQQAAMMQQLINDAQVRVQQLEQAMTQTQHQLAVREQLIGYIPAEHTRTPAYAEMAEVVEQVQQANALTQHLTDLATRFETLYPGAAADLPVDYNVQQYRNDMLNWSWSVQSNAKGILLGNQKSAEYWWDQEAIARVVEAGWSEDTTLHQSLQLLLMVSTENVRQMLRLRQEFTNFTSMQANYLAMQMQKEINEQRMLARADAERAANTDSNFAGTDLDPSRGLVAPSRMGWKLNSPYVRR